MILVNNPIWDVIVALIAGILHIEIYISSHLNYCTTHYYFFHLFMLQNLLHKKTNK